MHFVHMFIFISYLTSVYCCNTENVDVKSSQLFVFPITSSKFNFSEPQITLRAQKYGYPDLPSWLSIVYDKFTNQGFLFGTPPASESSIKVEIIAWALSTYEVGIVCVNLNILPADVGQNYLSLKLTNYNVDDFLAKGKRPQILEIISKYLWYTSGAESVHTSLVGVAESEDSRKHAGDVYIKEIESASKVGDRRPIESKSKEGIYVTFSSKVPFTRDMLKLESEVKIMVNRNHDSLIFF